MNAREQVLSSYTVNAHGIIQTPGKFEGEMIYVPHFWNAGLEGFADQDDGKTFRFNITDEDRQLFPEIPSNKRVLKL